MKWPERHTCHAHEPRFRLAKGEWRPPRAVAKRGDDDGPDIQPTRECDYCGGMHAGDLLELLRGPALIGLEVAGWKYGWPHKIYVSGIPNPLAGVPTIRSWRYFTDANGVGQRESGEPRPEPATMTEKFYTEHLLDEGYDDEAFKSITDAIAARTGLRFEVREGKLFYRKEPTGSVPERTQ